MIFFTATLIEIKVLDFWTRIHFVITPLILSRLFVIVLHLRASIDHIISSYYQMSAYHLNLMDLIFYIVLIGLLVVAMILSHVRGVILILNYTRNVTLVLVYLRIITLSIKNIGSITHVLVYVWGIMMLILVHLYIREIEFRDTSLRLVIHMSVISRCHVVLVLIHFKCPSRYIIIFINIDHQVSHITNRLFSSITLLYFGSLVIL